ncbi:MAG: hypothetical protein K2L88_02370, partial [Clostridiales bacterium]|nr:hypothetical protein [Clostridiales bacterium]
TVLAPDYTAESARTNWWDDTVEVVGAVYTAAPRAIGFAIDQYVLPDKLTDGSDITIEVVDGEVAFNNSKNNVPEVLVKFRGVTLENGVDYTLTSDDVNAGAASFNLVGCGNFDGTISDAGEYKIVSGVNSWKSLPNIMQWTYGNYDKEINRITAEPLYDFKSNSGLWFTITTDKLGMNVASPLLEKIRLDSDGYVSDSVAVALSQLKVGSYYLSATVDEHSNYYELSSRGIEFRVFKGLNSWEITPTIKTWTEGEYTAENIPVAKAVFGMALVTVKDSNGKIVYSLASAVNELGSAEAGLYTLTAYVLGTDDYIGMDLYTVVFQIYEKPGMPVWGTLLIVFGVLLVVALVIFILWKKGVFRILTDSIMVSISTKATVDATIAAVQANKKNEEAKQRAAAERRKEARRNANKKKKEMPLEQQAAELEDKAKKAAERAERMKAKSEAIQLRAERMKELADKQAAEAAEAAAAAAEAEQALEAEAAAAEKAAAETPVTEAPTTETPIAETPAAEEPKSEQPTEEATAEELTAQEPEAEAAATENN